MKDARVSSAEFTTWLNWTRMFQVVQSSGLSIVLLKIAINKVVRI